MSETIPEDEDRGGDGAIAGAIGGPTGSGFGLEGDPDVDAIGGIGGEPATMDDDSTDEDSTDDETEGGTGADDGGPGSQNM